MAEWPTTPPVLPTRSGRTDLANTNTKTLHANIDMEDKMGKISFRVPINFGSERDQPHRCASMKLSLCENRDNQFDRQGSIPQILRIINNSIYTRDEYSA